MIVNNKRFNGKLCPPIVKRKRKQIHRSRNKVRMSVKCRKFICGVRIE